MKRTRRVAAVAIAAFVLAGFVLSMGPGAKAASAAAAGSTALTPAGAWTAERLDQTQGQQMTTGCNQITETGLTVGGQVSDWVTKSIQPASAVISIWHYDNASQHYKAAYFQTQGVPVDIPTFPSPVDAFFICVNASATAP